MSLPINPIKITEKAVKQIKKIRTEKNISEDYGLRVGMQGGGCGGMSFVLGFDHARETGGLGAHAHVGEHARDPLHQERARHAGTAVEQPQRAEDDRDDADDRRPPRGPGLPGHFHGVRRRRHRVHHQAPKSSSTP